MDYYLLKHKDVTYGLIAIDPDDGSLAEVKIYDQKYAPYLGKADLRKTKRWWDMRAVPGGRKDMDRMIREAGCQNSRAYLAKNLALSISDTYWICPIEMDLSWSDVNLYRLAGMHGGLVPFHRMSSYDPNASLGGQMSKVWDVREIPPVLKKTAWQYFGQQGINEVFATEIHTRQNTKYPFVRYEISKTKDHGMTASCPAFTSPEIEFISAYEVLESDKIRNDESLYDAYIRICGQHGIDTEYMRGFMDYQTATDFIISNTDEHLMNFGVIRNTDTMQLIGPAPVFDSGNSMFYADERKAPYDRIGLLERRITAFHDSEEKMISHIQNKKLVDITLLPSKEEVREFYRIHGLPEERAAFIAESYAVKCELFADFQSGKTISLYHERHRWADQHAFH